MRTMSENEILSVLKILKQDANACEAQLNQLRSVINMYEGRLGRTDGASGVNTNSRPHSDNAPPFELSAGNSTTEMTKYSDFPKEESLQFQIIFLLKKIGRAIRVPNLHEELNKALAGDGSDVTVSTNQIRSYTSKLKENGELLKVKFNNSNTLVFIGLPEWFEKDNEGKVTNYKEEFKPLKSDLPFGTNTIELL